MIEKLIERSLFASRWILAPIYLGMSVVLMALGIKFFQEIFHLVTDIQKITETNFILLALGLIDMLLVGGLIVMVMFSSYENFVSQINLEEGTEKLSWLGQLDTGTLKLKVAASIVAISSIHLLKRFMEIDSTTTKLITDNIGNVSGIPLHVNPLFWHVIIHLTFVISAVMMGILDKMSFSSHRTH